MSTIHYFYWYPSEESHYQLWSLCLWSCGEIHPHGHPWDLWCLQCSFLLHYPKVLPQIELALHGRHHQEKQQLLWWFNNRWFKHRLFNSCEFHVCTAVAFPLPSHPSLLSPLEGECIMMLCHASFIDSCLSTFYEGTRGINTSIKSMKRTFFCQVNIYKLNRLTSWGANIRK